MLLRQPLVIAGRREGYILTPRQMKLILGIPKAENHIHIEGSILPRTLLRLSKRNNVPVPVETEEDMYHYIIDHVHCLNEFMACDRMFNSVCLTEQDYEEVIYDLAVDARSTSVAFR